MNTSKLTRRGFVVLSLGAMASACTPYTYTTSTKPSGLSSAVVASKINEVRRANGRKPVRYNSKLAAAAQSQADLMASKDTLSHDLGVTLRERVTAAGYVGAVGENLAGGHATLEKAIEGWLQSNGHRGTLLNDKFVEFGLAVAHTSGKSRYSTYWALIMGGDYAAWVVRG